MNWEYTACFYSGDAGFADQFQQIADSFGGVDMNIIEVGVHDPSDACDGIHFDPEQAVEAHDILGRKRMLAARRAAFTADFHDWYKPTERH